MNTFRWANDPWAFAHKSSMFLLVLFLLAGLLSLAPLVQPALAEDGDASLTNPGTSNTTSSGSEISLAVDDAYTTLEDAALAIAAPGVLVNDGAATQIASYHAQSHSGGTISMDPDGAFRYTPPPGFAGYDAFAYTTGEGQQGTGTATVMIEVEARNDRSIAVDLHSFDLSDDRQSPAGYILITNQSDGYDIQITGMAIGFQYRVRGGDWEYLEVVERSCRFGPSTYFSVSDQQLVNFYGCALVDLVPNDAMVRLTAEVEIYGLIDAEGNAEARYLSRSAKDL